MQNSCRCDYCLSQRNPAVIWRYLPVLEDVKGIFFEKRDCLIKKESILKNPAA
jgi:hypothetical protein